MNRTADRMMAPLIMDTTADQLHLGITNPNAVLAAAGCSVSVITIRNMLNPTDTAAAT